MVMAGHEKTHKNQSDQTRTPSRHWNACKMKIKKHTMLNGRPIFYLIFYLLYCSESIDKL